MTTVIPRLELCAIKKLSKARRGYLSNSTYHCRSILKIMISSYIVNSLYFDPQGAALSSC